MKERKITDSQLAAKLGCANSTVYQWRQGHFAPRAEYVVKICEILKCSADELFGINVTAPVNLNRAMSKDLYKAITKSGDYNSCMIHAMATRVQQARNGKITEYEKWLRSMAEAVYKIEIALKRKNKPIQETQLTLF